MAGNVYTLLLSEPSYRLVKSMRLGSRLLGFVSWFPSLSRTRCLTFLRLAFGEGGSKIGTSEGYGEDFKFHDLIIKHSLDSGAAPSV